MLLATQYLIEPRQDFVAWLTGRVDVGLMEILLEPVVLVNPEGGRSVWVPQDHALSVKLLYLASLRQYPPLDTDSGFEKVLGSPRINVSVFDHWWTLRDLPGTDRTEELRPFLLKHFASVDPTGNELVDSWFEWLRDKAEPGAPPSGGA